MLSRAITELGSVKSFSNLNKTDVVFSFSEIEELEVAVSTLSETTSWMDWWT